MTRLFEPNKVPCQQVMHPFFDAAGIRVSVLRLDLLHPVISGNKWMKLQPWLQEVKEKKLKGIITKGGPWSNHLHAAAYAANLEGLACTLVVKAKEGMMTPALSDALGWNAEIVYAPGDFGDEEKWKDKAASEKKLLIPLGGEGDIAARGVAIFIRNLNLPAFQHVICPIGTGTTLEGIALSGIAPGSLTGINPGIKDEYREVIKKIKSGNPAIKIDIQTCPELKKFGKWPGFLPELMNEWFNLWQIPTDLIYTSKMFYCFFKMIENGRFTKGDSVLLVHTGGLQGNRSLPAGRLVF